MARPKFKFVPDDIRNAIIEECARCVPTNWLDPMLSGPKAVRDLPGSATELLLTRISERIRALRSGHQ